MDDFENLSAKSPATLEAVLTIVNRLSALSEVRIAELASSGKLLDWAFAFALREIAEDTVAEEDLVVASPTPKLRE